MAPVASQLIQEVTAHAQSDSLEVARQICADGSYCLTFYLSNPSNTQLNPICHLLALLGAYHFLHVSRIRVKILPCSKNFKKINNKFYIIFYMQ